jgi:hypothetical protein
VLLNKVASDWMNRERILKYSEQTIGIIGAFKQSSIWLNE